MCWHPLSRTGMRKYFCSVSIYIFSMELCVLQFLSWWNKFRGNWGIFRCLMLLETSKLATQWTYMYTIFKSVLGSHLIFLIASNSCFQRIWKIIEPLKKSKSLLFWFLKNFRIEEPLVLGFFTQKASKSWRFSWSNCRRDGSFLEGFENCG